MTDHMLPPARRRIRQGNQASPQLLPSTQSYLASFESSDRQQTLRNALIADLAPSGVIEQLWVDDIAALEWEAHRLRSAKKAALDLGLRKALEAILGRSPQANSRAAQISGDWVGSTLESYFAGDPWALQEVETLVAQGRPGFDLMGEAYLEVIGIMNNLEKLLLACDSRRDVLISNLYGRRELLQRQRLSANLPAE